MRLAVLTFATSLCVAAFASAQEPQLVGACGFNRLTSNFAGDTARAQALCLLQPVAKWGNAGPALDTLPPGLDTRVGAAFGLDAERTRAALLTGGLPAESAATIGTPLSTGGVTASHARYFIIHDTSTPYYGDAAFPENLDESTKINSFAPYQRESRLVHMYVNRKGELYVKHEFAKAHHGTKLETPRNAGASALGLFLHVELIQPRRRDPAGGAKNDAIAPDPGFSPAQYRRLAQLYVLASVRAGVWLIPGFHANVDRGIPDAHDDPQNFDLAAFDAAVSTVVAEIGS